MNEPRVGCGAAIVRDGQLLLIRRARPPEAGSWGLPGGKMDLWETVEQTVRREIAEEIGVRLIDPTLLCVVDQIQPEEGAHWVAPTLLVEAIEGEPAILEPEKHTGLGWFGLDDLPEPLTLGVRQAVAALKARGF